MARWGGGGGAEHKITVGHRSKTGQIDNLSEQECLDLEGAGIRPILNAMQRVLSKYGAYTNHLLALSKDPSVQAVDRARLNYMKWINSKCLLGCAMFVDLLKPCAVFSKVMQRDEVDILCAMTSIVKTVKEVKKLGDLPLESWPTYSATIKKITCENGDYIYQCQTLKAYDQGKSVTECLKSRLKWSNIDLIRDIIIILETQGWQKIVEKRESRSETLDPLQAAVELDVQEGSWIEGL